MNVDSLRADGWQDAIAFLTMTILAVYLWYTTGLYLDWVVFAAGIGAGVVVYLAYKFAETRPVAGFPIAILFVIIVTAAAMTKSLAAGAVSALTVATAIKLYEVYS